MAAVRLKRSLPRCGWPVVVADSAKGRCDAPGGLPNPTMANTTGLKPRITLGLLRLEVAGSNQTILLMGQQVYFKLFPTTTIAGP